MPELGEGCLEAIEVLLRSRYRMVEEEEAPQSLWVRLFGGCLVEEARSAASGEKS